MVNTISDQRSFCTILSESNVAAVRGFAKALLDTYSNAQFFVLLVDQDNGWKDLQNEPFEVISIYQLDCIKDKDLPSNTSLKTLFLEYLSANYKLEKIHYFDPEVVAKTHAMSESHEEKYKSIHIAKAIQRPFGVNVVGFFDSKNGLGMAGRSTYLAIQKNDIPCCAYNFVTEPLSKDVKPFEYSEKNPYLINLMNFNADTVEAFFGEKGIDFFDHRFNIGYWNWELDEFPNQWRSAFDFLHEVWVPSVFTQKSVQTKSPIPVHCIPFPVVIPKHLSAQFNRAHFNLPDDVLIFLFAFDYHSIFERKNPVAAIKAFIQAFGHQKDVLLVLKSGHSTNFPESVKTLKALSDGYSNIRYIDELFTREEMYSLTKNCDVFVSLHRCEGYGLNVYEAMAMEKPVIATDYSSTTDFLNASNGYPIRYEVVTLEKDYLPYKKGNRWANPDVEHAAETMRHIYQNREEAQTKALAARKCIEKYLSYEAVGQLIKERLLALPSNTLHQLSIHKTSVKGFFNYQLNAMKKAWNVNEYKIGSQRALIGNALIFLRRVGRWFARPLLEKQTSMNESALQSILHLSCEVEQLKYELHQLKKEYSTLDSSLDFSRASSWDSSLKRP